MSEPVKLGEHSKSRQEEDFSIKPQKFTPRLNTSEWPLLLK
ncbi:24655_t:CDS:1, partial [Racocetra persica]